MNRAMFTVAVVVMALHASAADAPPAPTQKSPIPDSTAIKSAAALVEETFGKDISSAKTTDQKKALVQALLKAGRDEKEAVRYVLLTRARDLSAGTGDLDGCVEAMDNIEQTYAVDVPHDRFETYVRIIDNIRTTADREQLCADISSAVQSDLSAESFETAEGQVDLGIRASRASGDSTLIDQANADMQKLRTTIAASGEAKKALAVLETHPTDPTANLKVGKFRCLVLGNWPGGLRNLSLSNDPALSPAARLELAGTATADDQLKVADKWWDAAATLTGSTKVLVEQHAADWYESAAKDLGGLQKTKATKRAAEARALTRPAVDARAQKKLMGKWFEPSNNVTFTLNPDGTATGGTSLTGKWTINSDATNVKIKWNEDGWADSFELTDGKWTKHSYQNGVLKVIADINPP